jgi:hypothetical protein
LKTLKKRGRQERGTKHLDSEESESYEEDDDDEEDDSNTKRRHANKRRRVEEEEKHSNSQQNQVNQGEVKQEGAEALSEEDYYESKAQMEQKLHSH